MDDITGNKLNVDSNNSSSSIAETWGDKHWVNWQTNCLAQCSPQLSVHSSPYFVDFVQVKVQILPLFGEDTGLRDTTTRSINNVRLVCCPSRSHTFAIPPSLPHLSILFISPPQAIHKVPFDTKQAKQLQVCFSSEIVFSFHSPDWLTMYPTRKILFSNQHF